MKFKLVTYNIHRAIGLDRRFRPERISEILHKLDADVVLLQEVDEGVPRSKELNLAKVLAESNDYPFWKLEHNVTLRKGRYGNALLSRHPIVFNKNIDLTIGNKKKRGCLFSQIKIDNYLLNVFNLHLGLSETERQKQAAILLKSKEFKQIKPNSPTIVAGDFNDWRSMLRALFVVGKEFVCATDQLKNGDDVAIKTYPSFAPRGGLDRVYYCGDLKHLLVKKYSYKPAKIASDHLPLVTEFEFQ